MALAPRADIHRGCQCHGKAVNCQCKQTGRETPLHIRAGTGSGGQCRYAWPYTVRAPGKMHCG